MAAEAVFESGEASGWADEGFRILSNWDKGCIIEPQHILWQEMLESGDNLLSSKASALEA